MRSAETAQATGPGVTGRGWLRGNVLWLSIVSLLNDTASEMIYPLLPLFLTATLGASAAVLGAIEGAAESVSSLLKLASGWVSDRFGRRKPLVIAGYGVAAVVRPLIALAASPWHVLAIRLADRTGKGLRAAPRDALLAASVPAHERGRAFGFHRAADHAGALAGPIIASILLLVMGGAMRPVFALAAIPGALAVLVVLLRVREPARTDSPDPARSSAAGLPVSLRGLGPVLPGYLVAVFVFTLGNATDAFLLLRARDLGVPAAAIPLLWSALHVSKALWSVPGGVLADRIGARHAIVAGWLVYAATYAGFAAATVAWHAWALFLVYGLFYGLTESPEKALVAALAPEERRGRAFGAYYFAIGIGALPASIAFGVLWERFNPPTAFLAGAGLALLACVLLVARVPARAGRTP
ncbi:MAG: MFS transporter [Gemmatimonadetes bacterium]|nr:MFS transporter [Gemmatimonadota bacterium]